MISPLVVGAALLTPRAVHFKGHGFRGELLISAATDDIWIGEIVATREEAWRAAGRELLRVAGQYV